MRQGQLAVEEAPEVVALPRPSRLGRRGSRRVGAGNATGRAARATPRATRPKLRVLVCSDDPFTRRAFSSGAGAPDMAVVAKVTLTDAVERIAANQKPD